MNIEAIVPKDLTEAKELATLYSRSTFAGKDLKGSPENCLLIILSAMELGFMPMQGMRMFSIISGKVALTADGIAALVMKRRDVCEYLTMKELTDDHCTYVGKRVGGQEFSYTFTMADAKKAGLINHMYQKFPRPMLRARCISAISKAGFPDLAAGLYEDDTGEITGNQPSPNYGKETPRVDVMGPPVSAIPTREPGSDDGDEPEKQNVIDAHQPTPLDLLTIRINECQTLAQLKAMSAEVRKMNETLKDEQDKAVLQAAFLKTRGELEKAKS